MMVADRIIPDKQRDEQLAISNKRFGGPNSVAASDFCWKGKDQVATMTNTYRDQIQ